MAKNDFDIDFDFEKEYGFDPKAFLGAEEYDENIDLSEFSDEELGLSGEKKETATDADDPEDFNLDEMDLEDHPEDDLDDFLNMGIQEEAQEDVPGFFKKREQARTDEPEPEVAEPEDFPEEPEVAEPEVFPEEPEEPEPPEFEDQPMEEEPKEKTERKRRPPKERKPLPKIVMPNIFTKFFDLYFAPVLHKELREAPVDPDNPRRRRRKTPGQIFKEVYLPPLIACVCLILVLSFGIGAISNAIEAKRDEDSRKQSQLESVASAAQLAEQRNQQLLAEAEELAAVYDYNGAIEKLDSIGDLTAYPDIQTKRSEYITTQSQLVEYKDYSMIPNLSFHVLIEDLTRALKDADLGGLYNRNFVSTGEFRKILDQLYNNGYVLVDFNSFVGSNTDLSGNQIFEPVSIWLPAGKKPIMITETMVNYYNYMIDGNDDKVADANGDGFASRLVVSNGEIKAEYVSGSGETLVGDYDLVPILETFLKEHPDFSYRGARATLAVSGSEGIFGYRCVSDYVATKGQEYVDGEIAGAKEIVQALRDKGYTLACYTYNNQAYGQLSVQQISADLQLWAQKITPVIGNVDVLVFAKNSNITDYNGQAFKAIYSAGFRYFVAHGSEPYAEVNTGFVRQNRIMVTGENMVWYSDYFTKDSIFDPNTVVDLATRGSVPKG